MPEFDSFDRRGYRNVGAREGYGLWAATYEQTIKHDMASIGKNTDPELPDLLVNGEEQATSTATTTTRGHEAAALAVDGCTSRSPTGEG